MKPGWSSDFELDLGGSLAMRPPTAALARPARRRTAQRSITSIA